MELQDANKKRSACGLGLRYSAILLLLVSVIVVPNSHTPPLELVFKLIQVFCLNAFIIASVIAAIRFIDKEEARFF